MGGGWYHLHALLGSFLKTSDELRITHYCSGRPTPSGGGYVVGQGEGPLAERIMGLFMLKFMC